MRHILSDHRVTLSTIATWAMFSRGLEPEFSEAVQKQTAAFTGPAKASGDDIRDLRDLLWCSIDNDDSRDLDQLTFIAPQAHGEMRVYVAVADVDALVKKDSPIDLHAHQNTTSVYTSAQIFPMLPERLCTDLTSLNPDVDRLAVVTEMTFSQDGMLMHSSVYRARVHNKAQLAYDAVSAWIEGESDLPEPAHRVKGMNHQLRLQDELAQKLRVLRRAEGSLEFETFQPKALFQGARIVDIQQQPQNRARQLIEEFMIAANTCTAKFLAHHGHASLRRVVRSPERWQRIVALAATYDEHLPPEPDSAALERFLAKRHKADPVRFPDLSLIIVKLMGSGEYVVEHVNSEAIGQVCLCVTTPTPRRPTAATPIWSRSA